MNTGSPASNSIDEWSPNVTAPNEEMCWWRVEVALDGGKEVGNGDDDL